MNRNLEISNSSGLAITALVLAALAGCGRGGSTEVTPPPPPAVDPAARAPNPSATQAVVELGALGGEATLQYSQQTDSWTHNGQPVTSGSELLGDNNQRYRLIESDGTWTAEFVSDPMPLTLGTSGESVQLFPQESGSYQLEDATAVEVGDSFPVENGNRYVLQRGIDGRLRAALEIDLSSLPPAPGATLPNRGTARYGGTTSAVDHGSRTEYSGAIDLNLALATKHVIAIVSNLVGADGSRWTHDGVSVDRIMLPVVFRSDFDDFDESTETTKLGYFEKTGAGADICYMGCTEPTIFGFASSTADTATVEGSSIQGQFVGTESNGGVARGVTGEWSLGDTLLEGSFSAEQESIDPDDPSNPVVIRNWVHSGDNVPGLDVTIRFPAAPGGNQQHPVLEISNSDFESSFKLSRSTDSTVEIEGADDRRVRLIQRTTASGLIGFGSWQVSQGGSEDLLLVDRNGAVIDGSGDDEAYELAGASFSYARTWTSLGGYSMSRWDSELRTWVFDRRRFPFGVSAEYAGETVVLDSGGGLHTADYNLEVTWADHVAEKIDGATSLGTIRATISGFSGAKPTLIFAEGGSTVARAVDQITFSHPLNVAYDRSPESPHGHLLADGASFRGRNRGPGNECCPANQTQASVRLVGVDDPVPADYLHIGYFVYPGESGTPLGVVGDWRILLGEPRDSDVARFAQERAGWDHDFLLGDFGADLIPDVSGGLQRGPAP